MTRSKHRVVHFSDGLGPICGTVSEHTIGPHGPMFPLGISCSKCLKKLAGLAAALTGFKSAIEDALGRTDK